MDFEKNLELPEQMAALSPAVTPPPALPRRARDAHKGDFGRVYILAGSVGLTGAPALAAAGALRSGAGLVKVGVPQSAYPAVAAKLLCAMPHPLPEKDGVVSGNALGGILKTCRGMDGVLIGPGWGMTGDAPGVARGVIEWVDAPLVVDADGLNALAGHIDVLDTRRDKVTVLTPHFGEFCRLLGVGEVPDDPYEAARELAVTHGCVLVLKGHRTLTAFPDGKTAVNSTGNPGMASGGSGDVLAGMIVSLLAQGFDPEWAVPAAVYLHGRAGDLAAEALGEYAMTAGDVVEHLPAAMREAEERDGQ